MARGPVLRRSPARTPASPIEEALAQVTAAEKALARAAHAFEVAGQSYEAAEGNRVRAAASRDEEMRVLGFALPSTIKDLNLSTGHEKTARARVIANEEARSAAEATLKAAQQRLTDLKM